MFVELAKHLIWQGTSVMAHFANMDLHNLAQQMSVRTSLLVFAFSYDMAWSFTRSSNLLLKDLQMSKKFDLPLDLPI